MGRSAKINTTHAEAYLVQLATHWSHRFPDLTWNETRAEIPFAAGPCTVSSEKNVLTIAPALRYSECDLDVTWNEEMILSHLPQLKRSSSQRLLLAGSGRCCHTNRR
ncbi:DUF2218 domain-containing protein [Bradyrhizobium jicamae]|uniref:DUF2218 domain-containing protein n=1 Tax=Bradyrhizobium jicamae TaxID=280332 RepID=UPI001BA4BE79|nr:DUF2218 domain-containing protein [Bradyrhizobium jicamae]